MIFSPFRLNYTGAEMMLFWIAGSFFGWGIRGFYERWKSADEERQ